MKTDRARQAILNNAVWCDAVCQANGGTTVFTDDLWCNQGMSPSHFPKIITLRPQASFDGVETAKRAYLGEGVEVGDSFRTLDLTPLGFSPPRLARVALRGNVSFS